MALPTELRFGACEVHAQRHEVLRDGQVQDVPPKAFELLLFLLRERHRAVAKNELVAALWQQQAVSESVLARTLMKVRQAIGDPAAQPVWIKTIHGYGYRFVGEVIEIHPQGAAAQRAARHEDVKPGVRQRIGVLPCENQTGDAAFDWTKLGLMALVGHALEADERLEVVPMQSVLEAAGRLPADAPAPERVQHAQQALGLGWVVHASLRRQGGLLWLDYQLVAACGLTRGGSLRDAEAVALGERFARAISSGLFPGEGAPVAFESRDPYVNQAFARAIELSVQEQVKSAATLFDMVCEREPASLVAQLWRVRTLATLCDQGAAQACDALLAQARARGDARLQVMAHLAMGQALHLGQGDAEGAAVHYARAEELAQGLPDEWVGQAQLRCAYAAHACHRLDEARKRYLAADAAFRAAGNPLSLGSIQLHLAMLADTVGDPVSALQHVQDGLTHLESNRQQAYAEMARALLANLQAALGRHDRALELAGALLARLTALQSPQVAVINAALVARTFSEFGDLAMVQRAVELGDSMTPGDLGPRIAMPKLEAACHLALWCGDLDGLRHLVAQATAAPRQHPEAMLQMHLLHLRVEAAAGCFEAAAAVRERLAAHPLANVQVEAQAVVERAQAAEQLARGDAAGALSTLLALVLHVPFGREHARARIDAAWLLAEAGDAARAATMLAGSGAWRHEHPAGLAAQARLCHANGRAGEAQALQQQALDRFRGTPPEVHQALLRAYAGPTAAKAPALPRLARLATDSWLPALR
jgi:DNA-binding winged helix-turn-helix (wHTH) protein